MKRKMYLSLTALVLALAVNVAFAQSNGKIKADVLFAFSVEQNSMEAGQYSITATDHVLLIRNDSTTGSTSTSTGYWRNSTIHRFPRRRIRRATSELIK